LYAINYLWYDLTVSDLPTTTDTDFQEHFFADRPLARSLMSLFEYIPDIVFYAKDTESRFTRVNSAFLELFSFSHESDLLGRTDRDFLPPALAEAYIVEDQRVMHGREPITKQSWLVHDAEDSPLWYVSSKVPLYSPEDRVIGIAGAMYPIATPAAYFQDLWPAIRHMDKHYQEQVSIREMAELVGVSSTLFNQQFQTLLHMTPSDYLLTLRVQLARRLLTKTDQSITAVAADAGFYDQSHFCKRFRQFTGITPLKYRQRFR